MDTMTRNRIRGCAVGAAVGDALGMPLEGSWRQPADRLVREMRAGRLPAGTITDDTEMALALAESLLAHCPLDPADLAQRFVAWFRAGPDDIGNQTYAVLARIAAGESWEQAVAAVQRRWPKSAGNGSVMRCWPVALAYWDDSDARQSGQRLDALLADSRLQSQVTHLHADCVAGSAFVNAAIYYLLHGTLPTDAIAQALEAVEMPEPLRRVIAAAPHQKRADLANSGWVRHTLESAVWGLLNTDTFEEALVQVVNLGGDADSAGAVVGALAGAAHGLDAIPLRWRETLRAEWPLGSGRIWRADDFIALADALASCSKPFEQSTSCT
ncbi:MAG: ADP-ribosylglycohydrolase family protein [Chloroflexi bacterium]|nr:ADP-ribosylglycohydrolase family protein [Chloroflexota bacterium]